MNCRTSLTVCEGLNFATSRVPSARRICSVVVGWAGSRGKEGGAEEEEEEGDELVGCGDVLDTTSGATLEREQ